MNDKTELEGRLKRVDEELERAMRLRGFDSSQLDNVPLTPEIGALYTERQSLLEQLAEIGGDDHQMISEVERIQDQLRRSFSGGAWHGPSVNEVLAGVSATDAAARPVLGGHSIWELAMHIGAWERAALRRLAGDRAELSDEEDWQVITNTSEVTWAKVLANLEQGHQELLDAVALLDHSRLNQPILENMASVYVTLHGVVQHNIYHAGQIAILKKAILEKHHERTR